MFDNSRINLNDLKQGDEITLTYQSRDEQRRSFSGTVSQIESDQDTIKIILNNNATIFTSPPLLFTPSGEKLPLYTVKHLGVI